jgi:hypothetical protein
MIMPLPCGSSEVCLFPTGRQEGRAFFARPDMGVSGYYVVELETSIIGWVRKGSRRRQGQSDQARSCISPG